MREHTIKFPELVALVATRGIAGFGIGLLLSDRFGSRRRKSLGWALLAAGAVSTIPIAVRIFGAQRRTPRAVESATPEPARYERRRNEAPIEAH
jgi:hypothetical protein